ncbi:MAG: ERF family protein, partial [bacterium]|nr:ERF family protein [bacterium]
MKELGQIQSELVAPKNQRNNFGKYNYRSAEDILEAVKPLLAKYNCTLTVSDEVIAVLDRVYVKATAEISSSSFKVSTTALAREPLSQKGMNEAQITGSASSYARKYALN